MDLASSDSNLGPSSFKGAFEAFTWDQTDLETAACKCDFVMCRSCFNWIHRIVIGFISDLNSYSDYLPCFTWGRKAASGIHIRSSSYFPAFAIIKANKNRHFLRRRKDPASTISYPSPTASAASKHSCAVIIAVDLHIYHFCISSFRWYNK